MKNEQTSPEVARIAAIGMKHPEKLTMDEVKKVCASAATQAPDKDSPEITASMIAPVILAEFVQAMETGFDSHEFADAAAAAVLEFLNK